MNFFERQHAARGTSARLVGLFVVAVICIVAVIDAVVLLLVRSAPVSTIIGSLSIASAVTLLVIAGGTIGKTLSLRAGGSAVALSVGAVAVDPTSTDPRLRRLVNIVEEMSLASGVPVPRLFVLEHEPGINAFAAGYTPADAAITVTAGAMEQLNRDELQGVLGHEFSHILNGDMRLNIRLIGLLSGILLLGLIGLRLLMFGGGGNSRKNNGAAAVLVMAFVLMILGFVGQFFAGLIKAAVTRQREWLADASAVQFTRQTAGLAGALKKIAGIPTGSELKNLHGAREVSHMLFGEGGKSFSQLYATHPPLMKRIAALEPDFRPEQIEELRQSWQGQTPDGLTEDAQLRLADGVPRSTSAVSLSSGPAAPPEPIRAASHVTPESVSARVGTMSAANLAAAQELSARIPPRFRQLASQGSTAIGVTLAMMLNHEPEVQAQQLKLIAQQLGRAEAATTQALIDEVRHLGTELRLPVLSLASPLITARPRGVLTALVQTLEQMARLDGVVDLFEYCLIQLVCSYVQDASDPVSRSKPGRVDLAKIQNSADSVLCAMAEVGNDNPAAAEHAYLAGSRYLLSNANATYQPLHGIWSVLDDGWAALDSLDPRHKQRFIESLAVAVRDDGVLTLNEAELLRTTCALLHCPMPGFVA